MMHNFKAKIDVGLKLRERIQKRCESIIDFVQDTQILIQKFIQSDSKHEIWKIKSGKLNIEKEMSVTVNLQISQILLNQHSRYQKGIQVHHQMMSLVRLRITGKGKSNSAEMLNVKDPTDETKTITRPNRKINVPGK